MLYNLMELHSMQLDENATNTESWDDLLRIFCMDYRDNEFQYNVYANTVDLFKK